MLFWIGILIAVGFAYSAIKLGFYQAWTMLFNVVIAVYLGIYLGPIVEEFFPMGLQYSKTLAMLATGVGTFLILHGISYVFLIGQFEVTFPRSVNLIGSGFFGFLAGLLFWSFAGFLFCTTPFCEKQSVKEIGFSAAQFEQAKMQSYLVWWCNFVDIFVSSADHQDNADKTVKDLLTEAAKKNAPSRPEQLTRTNAADVNEPNDSNYPHTPFALPARRQIELPP